MRLDSRIDARISRATAESLREYIERLPRSTAPSIGAVVDMLIQTGIAAHRSGFTLPPAAADESDDEDDR